MSHCSRVGAHAFLRVGQSIQLCLEGSSLLCIRYEISFHNGILSCSAVFPDVPVVPTLCRMPNASSPPRQAVVGLCSK
jgi:hypothetical protein